LYSIFIQIKNELSKIIIIVTSFLVKQFFFLCWDYFVIIKSPAY